MRLESLLEFRRTGETTTAEVRIGREVVCIQVTYEDGSRATVVLDHAEMDAIARAWLARPGVLDGAAHGSAPDIAIPDLDSAKR